MWSRRSSSPAADSTTPIASKRDRPGAPRDGGRPRALRDPGSRHPPHLGALAARAPTSSGKRARRRVRRARPASSPRRRRVVPSRTAIDVELALARAVVALDHPVAVRLQALRRPAARRRGRSCAAVVSMAAKLRVARARVCARMQGVRAGRVRLPARERLVADHRDLSASACPARPGRLGSADARTRGHLRADGRRRGRGDGRGGHPARAARVHDRRPARHGRAGVARARAGGARQLAGSSSRCGGSP